MSSAPPGLPEDLDAAFGSAEFRTDPYPVYERMRAAGPVLRSARHRVHFVTTHQAVGEVLRARSATVDSPFRASRVLFGRTVMDVDGAEHSALRALTNRSFSASAIPGYLDGLVPSVVAEVLDGLAERPAPDGVADFANRVPIGVMSRIIGLAPADVPEFRSCSDAMIAFLDAADPVTRQAAVQAWARMRVLLVRRIEQMRPAPDGSVIGQLLAAAATGDRVDDDEIVRQVGLLIPAAIDTSNRLIANVLHVLCTRPELLDRVRGEANLTGPVVEETLRFEPPIHSTVRIWGGGELCGRSVPRGALLTVLLGSANRDPEVFADPVTFDPDRPANARHLAFGAGRHQCMGRRMALAEVTIALRALFARFPRLRAYDLGRHPIRGLCFRSPASLPLDLGGPS